MLPLRELLHSMTSDRPPEPVVDEFVTFCRKTAVVLLRKKIALSKLNLNHLSLSVDDLALDCVADLFSRNEKGSFTQLQVYMRGFDPCRMTEAELTAYLRRLVFAKVNQGIFRIYHEIDPSLSKIIRNIKLSVNALENFTTVNRFGETYLAPSATDPLEHLPLVDPAMIREELRRLAGKNATIPELMACLSRCLQEQTEYSRFVSIVQVALIIRGLYSESSAAEETPSDAESAASVSDATEVIEAACRWVKERAGKKYVDAGKVCAEFYGHYFTVIETALLHSIPDHDADDVKYFEELSKHIPGLTLKDYRNHHKSKIEYLGRIARRRALKELKRIF